MRYINMILRGQRGGETVLYLVLWAVLFAAPVVSLYVEHYTTGAVCEWDSVFMAWRVLSFFFGLFLVHNFLLAPLLVYGGKRRTYFALVALLMVCFSLYQCHGRQHPEPPREERPMRGRMEPRPAPDRPRDRHAMPPARPFGGEDMVQILVVALLLGLNVGAKAYFKGLDDKRKTRDLAHEHLQVQLLYLKYQINPHFFMNTLNNIHALVEFDPEKAQTCIEILSELMRYVLYEANRPLAPLEKELLFVGNYIDIMRIRYVDAVSIETHWPRQVPDVTVPPLIFATFIENAFKHGVSYEQPSFVRIDISTGDGHVDFRCVNSRKPQRNEQPGGVGLQNVKKRLALIYGDTYTLYIRPEEHTYSVHLRIPFTTKTSELS